MPRAEVLKVLKVLKVVKVLKVLKVEKVVKVFTFNYSSPFLATKRTIFSISP